MLCTRFKLGDPDNCPVEHYSRGEEMAEERQDICYKQAAKNNWSKNPCGSRNIKTRNFDNLTFEDFAQLDKARYTYEYWMQEEFDNLDLKDKRVLEIGYGMGSDHLQLAMRGGTCYGIDLTPENLPICQKHLELNGFSSKLCIGDATELPYEDNFFDVIYTFGVIHHIPKMEKVINEIYRVLKPGGIVWCGVYNKNSWFYRCILLPDFVFSGDFKRMNLKQRLSLIEYPHKNKNILVTLTTKRELRKLFYKYKVLDIKNRSISRDYFKINGKHILNEKEVAFLGSKFGWYNIVIAQK